MAGQPIHLVIATPCYGGQVTSESFTSFLKLQLACLQRGLRVSFRMTAGDALITRARQELLASFLQDPSATHLLFIDADIGFEPEQVFRLLDFNQDMAAGLYPLKRMDWGRIRKLAQANYPNLEPATLSYVHELDPKASPREDGFAKATYVGTGFLMLKRGVLLAMCERYSELKYRGEGPPGGESWHFALFNCFVDPKTQAYLSEDYSFCRRWTDMGGEIWVDLKSRLTHTGPATFNGDAAVYASLPKSWTRSENPAPSPGRQP